MAYKDKEKQNQFMRDRYAKNVEIVKNIKLESGCIDCGYNDHHAGLEFDHILPRKRGTVASVMGRSIKVIMEEIERCEIVCGTCHNIRTYERRQRSSSIMVSASDFQSEESGSIPD